MKFDTKKMFAPKPWGWRFVAFDLQMPNGQLVEFYAPVPEMDRKAVKGPNHDLFEKWRNVADSEWNNNAEKFAEITRDILTSKSRYDAAFAVAIRRMGYSDERAAAAAWESLVAKAASVQAPNRSISSTAVAPPLTQTPSRPIRMAGNTDISTASINFPSSSSQTNMPSDGFEGLDVSDSDGVVITA